MKGVMSSRATANAISKIHQAISLFIKTMEAHGHSTEFWGKDYPGSVGIWDIQREEEKAFAKDGEAYFDGWLLKIMTPSGALVSISNTIPFSLVNIKYAVNSGKQPEPVNDSTDVFELLGYALDSILKRLDETRENAESRLYVLKNCFSSQEIECFTEHNDIDQVILQVKGAPEALYHTIRVLRSYQSVA